MTHKELLAAAIEGLTSQRDRIEVNIAKLRQELLGKPVEIVPTHAKRTVSVAARKRMAAAQQKRWAEKRKAAKAIAATA